MNKDIWIVDDDDALRFIIADSLEQWGYSTRSFSSGTEALSQLMKISTPPALIISDVKMPGLNGMNLLEKSLALFPKLPFIITTAYSDLDSTVAAYQQGVFDYLAKPFDLDELQQLVKQVMRQNDNQNRTQEKHFISKKEIIGNSPAMQQLYRAIGKLAKTKVNVLISGETGTGKELIARALHTHSPVNTGNFVALNMAAIPSELAESELFGYEKGAFTGATQARKGRFAQANNGTLFLDEIGDMSLSLQSKLLRATAEGDFYPIGSQQPQKSNARIIAASHKDLSNLVNEQKFREDLYHRLNVIHLYLPPLRERGSDIIELLDFHLQKAAKTHQMSVKKLSEATKHFLLNYAWPGNIRQLENLCQQLTIMSPVDIIEVEDLPKLPSSKTSSDNTQMQNQGSTWQEKLANEINQHLAQNENDIYPSLLESFDSVLITAALQYHQNHKQNAAFSLGIGRNTLTRKLSSNQYLKNNKNNL